MSNQENQNAAIYFLNRHVAEGRGDKVAFIEADGQQRSITYSELANRSTQFAGALARAGLRREERLAMIMLDEIEFPITFFGALAAGVIPIPINTLLTAELYTTILDDSRASVLVVSSALWPTVAPAVQDNPHLRHIIVTGETPGDIKDFDHFTIDAVPQEPVQASADELAFWLYSSGSTGAPKGVKHVHGSMQATADTFGSQTLGIQENDVIYSAAKLFFAYGLGNGISFPMSVGATTILLAGRPTPDAVFDIMARLRPTIFCGVPTLFAALVSQGQAPEHSIRLSTSAGEALPRDIGERWDALWGSRIIDGVGSTEMLHIFLSNQPDDLEYGTSGTPVPGYDVRLAGDQDAEVANDEVGELLVRGASASDGYWNQRAKSRATFQGEWTRTGDKYTRRADGRFIYCGRTDDMFKVSGIWVSPFEVEQALVAHPSVLEAAVVARRDDAGLEKPAAFVVLEPGATLDAVDELKAFVQDKVGKWKYPRWVEVVEELPKTATGKIQRFKLR